MNTDKRRILEMLAEGKISTDEADSLLSAVGSGTQPVGTVHAANERMTTAFEDRSSSEISFDLPESGVAPESGSSDSPAKQRYDTFKVGESPHLQVRNFNGRISLKAEESDEIKVRATLKNPRNLVYSASQSDDNILVHAEKKSGIHFWPRQAGALMEITAPPGTTIDLVTSNGRIELKGIHGSGPVFTSNGKIEMESVKGDHEVVTSNGSITALGYEGDGDLKTSNGSIRVERAKGVINAQTSNGSIQFECELPERGRCRLDTSNGSIRVKLAGEPNLKIDAETSSHSRVTCDLPTSGPSSEGRGYFRGTAGTGSGDLIVRSSNGSIHIGAV